jgi:hypothetical protein
MCEQAYGVLCRTDHRLPHASAGQQALPPRCVPLHSHAHSILQFRFWQTCRVGLCHVLIVFVWNFGGCGLTELLAEEIAKSRETHQRRASEGNLPFLITPTISVMVRLLATQVLNSHMGLNYSPQARHPAFRYQLAVRSSLGV